MTLSQRLTRAGLVFILFGTVAVALPQQNGAALADNNCVVGTHTFKIVGPGGSPNNYALSPSTTYHFGSFYDGTPAGNIGGGGSQSSGTAPVLTITSSNTADVTTGSGAGSGTIIANYNDGATAYNVSTTFTY